MSKAKRKKIKILKLNQIFFLVVVTTIIVNVLSFARYKTTTAGSSAANVAIPIITLSNNVLELENLRPNTTHEYDFYVTTKVDEKVTEVSMEYELELVNYSNIPIKMRLYQCDDLGNVLQECILDEDNTTEKRIISFGDNNEGETHNYKIHIIWDETDNDYRYNLETEYIEIKLNSNQID